MRKLISWIIRLAIFFTTTVLAEHYLTSGDVYLNSDTNWQQSMLDKFYNPQNQMTDFSFPSGIFRKACNQCEYDLQTVSCYCQDVAGLISYFPTRLTVNNCQNIYDNKSGMLKCAG